MDLNNSLNDAIILDNPENYEAKNEGNSHQLTNTEFDQHNGQHMGSRLDREL